MNTQKNLEKMYNTPTTRNMTGEQVAAAAQCSHKVDEIRSVLRQLGLYQLTSLMVQASPEEDIDDTEMDREGYRNITESAVQLYAGMVRTCARKTAKARRQHDAFYQKMDAILAKPFSKDDYLAAYERCPMSRNEYLAAEREACVRLYQETTNFNMLIVVFFKNGPRTIPVPEAQALRILKETGSGTAARAST